MNNKIAKNLIVLFLAFVLGSCFSIYSAQAQNDNLILEVTKECDIKSAGNSCVAELKITNNAGEILDGTASLHIKYQGACSNDELENFDGVGITAQFSVNNVDWLNFSGFEIAKGETQPKLKIETVSNLCPGKYTFTLSVKGTFEEEEYVAPTVAVGGGGGSSTTTPPVTTALAVGNIKGYGAVNEYDFSLMMSQWGETGSNLSADLNQDGVVDEYDFSLLMANWGL